jgi:dolichol-phosphate mannosyltransferase
MPLPMGARFHGMEIVGLGLRRNRILQPLKFAPLLALLALTSLFVGFLSFFWLQQPPSNQELLANYAKVADYVRAAASVRGVPWWTPSFLQGCSLAFLSLGALSSLTLYVFAVVVGPYVGVKIAALVFLFLCPLAMFAFIRRLCPDSGWTAFSCGAAYLFAPAVLLRLGHLEHVANVLAFAAIPLAFRGMLVFLEERTARSAIECAAANALLVLSYAKIAILVLPLLLAFTAWAWAARARFFQPSWRILALGIGIFLLLGVLPNLPSLREARFIAMFDFGPFEAWQRGYSAESVISWIDRGGTLTGRRMSAQSEVRASSSYLGIVALACVTGLFFLRKRAVWTSTEATIFRLFVALTLFAHWFGLGVNSPLSGQLAFLSHADSAWDPAIAISWGLLVLQGVAIWLILPGSVPGRSWLVAAAVLIYFLVPGFRLIEHLPLYGDIRAPHDFFEMGGVFCFSVAAGIGTRLLLLEMPSRALRLAVAVILTGLAFADSASAVPSFFKGPIDRQTFDDFLAAQRFLAEQARPGRVAPYSGRYFYLLTPILSGRGLIAEAFHSHLMLRGVAELQRASFLSRENFATFLDIAGVSQLLIDKKDPDTPQSLQESLRSLASPVFENEHFVIFDNPDSFYPAALARYFIELNEPPEEAANRSLTAAAQGLLAVGGRTKFNDNEGLLRSKEVVPASNPMTKIGLDSVQRKTAERIAVDHLDGVGWLVIPEAYHPDWKASRAGQALEVARAYGAFLAVRLDNTAGTVFLSFEPPWWYLASVLTATCGWIGVIALLVAERLAILPPRWRAHLLGVPKPRQGELPSASAGVKRSTAGRIIVIIPTYNEASGIWSILDQALGADPSLEIVVVDDNSPDQTAEAVRSHGAFGRRVHLIARAGKLGLGSAYKDGFRWAMERGFDSCVQIDADLSHDPGDIPRLIAALENGADVAIGSRYAGGVRVLNWPQGRLFLSIGASKFVRALTGLPLTDATSGFKAIRCDVLRRLDWSGFKTEGYGFQVELHYFLWKADAVLVEVPIVFTERRAGQTKMTAGIALEAIWRVLQLAMFKR